MFTSEGRGNTPFHGGLLCLARGDIRRTTVVDSGGAGSCDGAFQIDMNCFAAGGCGGNPPAYLSSVGQQVNCQWWGRDSVMTGSFMSDALEYIVVP